jgi:hypothetical protein
LNYPALWSRARLVNGSSITSCLPTSRSGWQDYEL